MNIEVPDQTSLKETEITTGTTLSIQQQEERKNVTINSKMQMNDELDALHIKLLSITDLDEVSVLIPKIFQTSRHNWGPALGLPDIGFPDYMKTYLSEPMLIEELGCFGVRFEGNSKLVGALILENGPPLEVKKKEESNKDEGEDGPEVSPVLLEAYQAITGLLAECEELFRSEYLRRHDQGDTGYKMDSKLAYVAYIAIDESCRGRGVAGTLVDTGLKKMIDNSYEFAVAYCVSPNARHVFEKQGFELWGQIPYKSYEQNGKFPYSVLPDEVSILVK
eukprot:CAMPEP_0119047278 /NCGR_PEP_ID=MMETSP1177-20130426/52196_1 /TAXON_ID=2985 /ORGANISM="Ochromonas sp, Strain CCMP1899" /LENGTH=277 /DNA_ID=CAMNT_0007021653 /DNA_START=231 /DNA_END=1061 /DNA_ORIENTATION=+